MNNNDQNKIWEKAAKRYQEDYIDGNRYRVPAKGAQCA